MKIVVDGEEIEVNVLFRAPDLGKKLGRNFKLQKGPAGVALLDDTAQENLGLKKQPSEQPSKQK